ncbi:acetate/propionate family kinase [Aliishimia ponticola]|uniref:Acetate kinase n=1 Tax=Aliishimia ponticola TaxID=2499833 RepID=A0A4S4NGX4_9RHOB|nr:acetate/propionate family kinase [Aliishimia ponticola]THH37428.1 acetate/propionate family kinase [Aliishimia ponticola]
MAEILTINAGSSSIKFAVFTSTGTADLHRKLHGQVEGLGAEPRLIAKQGHDTVMTRALAPDEARDQAHALATILHFLESHDDCPTPEAIVHRIVHGGPDRAAPMVLDADTITALEALTPLAPLHQPHNLAGVKAAQTAFPGAVQIGCFDTAFHRAHPWVADTYALPGSYYQEGIRRYGFHGLSYEHATRQLRKLSPERAKGRTIVTHLGSGCSMCAMQDGQSVTSSMGFTALDGLPMGTRCGQLDPGVVLYLMQSKGMNADEIETLLYKQSGLKGLSGLSHDMRLLEEAGTAEAEGAIDYFVHRIRREIGAHMAILGGLDALVFTGGIGENAPNIRARVCEGFEWCGLELDTARNAAGETEISSDASEVQILLIPCDEEGVMAQHGHDLMT